MGKNVTANFFDRGLGQKAAVLYFGFILLLLSAGGQWIYGLPFVDTLKFLAGVFVLFYVPGSLLIRPAGFQRLNFLTQPVLALATGTVVVPFVYRLLRILHWPEYIVVGLVVLCFAIWLYLKARTRTDQALLRLNSVDLLGTAALLVFILALLHFSHFTDVLLGSAGLQFRSTDMTESVFHLGLINSLSDIYPPPSLYASSEGNWAAYHMNMHLQAELLLSLFRLESLYLVVFYIPLFYFTLLVMLPYVFVREAGGTALTGIVCGMLVFGADFSFIPAILLNISPESAWTTFFYSTIWSLFTLNGYLPGVVGLFLCIIVLHDYFRSERRANLKLALFALLAYGAFGFKSPLGLQLGTALLATGLLMVFYGSHRKQGWPLIAFSVASLSAIYFDLSFFRSGVESSGVGSAVVRFDPMNGFHGALAKLGMSDMSTDWYLPMIAVILVAGLGVRSIGLYFLGHRLSRENPQDWSLVFIGVFFMTGLVVTEMFFIGVPKGQNNSGWFYIQSLMAAWFLLFLFLIRIQDKKSVYLATVLAVVMLSAPSTVQFLHLRASDKYVNFGPDEIELVEYLRETDPKSVFLHPLNHDRPSLASNFAGRITVLSVWVSFVTESSGLSERAQDVMLFFDEESPASERLQVLEKYGVDYVYGSGSELRFMEDLPEAELEVRSGDMVLYRIQQLQGKSM